MTYQIRTYTTAPDELAYAAAWRALHRKKPAEPAPRAETAAPRKKTGRVNPPPVANRRDIMLAAIDNGTHMPRDIAAAIGLALDSTRRMLLAEIRSGLLDRTSIPHQQAGTVYAYHRPGQTVPKLPPLQSATRAAVHAALAAGHSTALEIVAHTGLQYDAVHGALWRDYRAGLLGRREVPAPTGGTVLRYWVVGAPRPAHMAQPSPVMAQAIAAIAAGAVTTADVAAVTGKTARAAYAALAAAVSAGHLNGAMEPVRTAAGGVRTSLWWMPGAQQPVLAPPTPTDDAATVAVLAAMDAGANTARTVASAAGVTFCTAKGRLYALARAGRVILTGTGVSARYSRAPDGQVVPPS